MNRIEKYARIFLRELLLKWRNPGRYIIERKIFPNIKNKKVLLVGCAKYTYFYPDRLKDNELWSIDFDKEVAQYGAKRHIIGDVSQVDKYYEKDFFDVILFFGIFGFGLNDAKNGERAMENCYKILKKGGKMIIMWNDAEKYNPVVPEKLKGFSKFKRENFLNYKSGHRTSNNEVFEFLVKP
jgi:SAM-dependent methyltransferase